MNFRKTIVCAVVLVVILISIYWLWDLDRVLTKQAEWCTTQTEAYPLNVCGGIAERDIQRTYYLKVIMLAVLAFGSMRLILLVSRENQKVKPLEL